MSSSVATGVSSHRAKGGLTFASHVAAMTKAARPGLRTAASAPARATAARRALRTAAVTFAGFALGRWAVGSVPVAVFATFTGLAITGIADYGGSLRGRAVAIGSTAILAVGLTALGTWISSQGVGASCAVMFSVVGAISLSGLLGGYAAAGSNALILFYVVAAGSAAPSAAILVRLQGVGIGGGLALSGALLLWPEPARPQALTRLGEALLELARRLRRLAAAAGDEPAPAPTTTAGIRMRIDALVDRPAAPTGAQRAALYLMNDIERLDALVTRLETESAARPDRAQLEYAAWRLSECGQALCPSDPWAPAAKAGELEREAVVEPFSLRARLIAVVAAAEAHTRAARGRDLVAGGFATAAGRDGPRAAAEHGVRRIRANLTISSVHVHDALRLGAGLALATATVDVFGLAHGFWVAFATLTVVKSNVRATARGAEAAIAGTLLGGAIAFALIAGLDPSAGVYLVLLPFVIAVAIYANVAVSFLAGQAGFTLVIVVLFNLLGPAGWRIGIVRLEDVLTGALAGLLIGAVAWPRGASAAIASATAELLERAADYLADTAHVALTGLVATPAGPTRRQLAADAAVRAESTFAQYLAEHPSPGGVVRWARLLSTGNRLWYAGDLIAAAPRGHTGPVAEAITSAERLREGYAQLARSLRNPGAAPEPVRDIPGDNAGAGGDLHAWLEDLAAGADEPADADADPERRR